jgi:hypothetical protein
VTIAAEVAHAADPARAIALLNLASRGALSATPGVVTGEEPDSFSKPAP